MLNNPRNVLTILIFAIALNGLNAQPRKGTFINASVGLGISAPYDQYDGYGSGFYAQGEYVLGLTKWIGFRPYAGFIITSTDKNQNEENRSQYEVTTNAFLIGGKTRIAAPIPYVAPYFEIGIGASIGSFVTQTPFTNLEEKGLIMHIPFTIGLAIGRNHNFEFAFTYYYHPSVDQFAGAAAFGMSFPLN